MHHTGVKATKEDTNKMFFLAGQGWRPGEPIIVFSVGEGINRDQATIDAKKVCHQLALDYGLPEIEGYYGMTEDGEFITF